MRQNSPLCAAPVVALVASVASADEGRLKNGDRYSGTAQLDAGTLTVKTSHGNPDIAWKEVAALTVDGPTVVRTVDGQEAPARAAATAVAGMQLTG